MAGLLDLDGLDGAAPGQAYYVKPRSPQMPMVLPPDATTHEEASHSFGDAESTVPAVLVPEDLAVALPLAEANVVSAELEDLATSDLGDNEVCIGGDLSLDQSIVPMPPDEPALLGVTDISSESWAVQPKGRQLWALLAVGLIVVVLAAVFYATYKSGWLFPQAAPGAADSLTRVKPEPGPEATTEGEAAASEQVSEAVDTSPPASHDALAQPTTQLVVRFPGRFGANEKKPKGAKRRRLQKVLDQLGACVSDLSIVGHASSDEKKPLRLSFARAKRAAKLLVARGFDPSRLAIEGKGSSEPAHAEGTRVGRRKDRRVMIHCQSSPP